VKSFLSRSLCPGNWFFFAWERDLLGDANDTAGKAATSVSCGWRQFVASQSEVILTLVDNDGTAKEDKKKRAKRKCEKNDRLETPEKIG
jgi:hypothetical protein